LNGQSAATGRIGWLVNKASGSPKSKPDLAGSGAMGNLKCEFRDGGVPRIREHALASEGSSLLPTPDTERALLDL